MKIGIFGGSFNPPHHMHKKISEELINHGYLDQVIYVPTGDNYNKKGLISFKHRFAMVKLMIKDNPRLSASNVGNLSDYQYTYQVLDYFQSLNPHAEIYFICGTDNLLELTTWKKYQYILDNYSLLVVRRNHDKDNHVLAEYQNYLSHIVLVDIDTENLSSTYIRNNIDNNHIKKHLNETVYNYLKNNHLY